MLGWADGREWLRDNRWQPLDTAPIGQPVDVWAQQWTASYALPRHTGKRFHGCVFDGKAWSGLPAPWQPHLWTEAMPDRRLAALTISGSAIGRCIDV